MVDGEIIAAGMSEGSTSVVAIEEIEAHHDLSAQTGVLSHDEETNYEYSSDEDEGEGGSGPLRNGKASGRKQSLIARMRRPDGPRFQALDQHEAADENDEQEQPQPQAPATNHYYGNMASPVRRQESDGFDNETRTDGGESSITSSPRHVLSRSFDEEFDEENFDEDLEYGISRYNPTPVRTNGRARGSAPGISRKESASSIGERIVAPVLDVVDRVKAARAEARRKRAEHLLEINDDRIRNRTRISVWFSTWCDMTVSDRGVLVAASFVGIFIAIYKLLDEEEDKELRRSLLVVGIPLLILRFTWRWLLWVTYGRWQRSQAAARLQLFDGMNDGAGASGMEIPQGNDDDSVSQYSVASSLMLSVVDNLNNGDDDELSLS